MNKPVFTNTFAYKLIYIFRINDEPHKGLLKIGDTTVESNKSLEELAPNCRELNQAAKNRIDQYTSTAGIRYELLHTEIALIESTHKAARDNKVHEVLIHSGIEKKYFDTHRKQNEWFKVDLETAKNAIKAVREGRKSLTGTEISQDRSPIQFRPEQEEAIKRTIAQFSKGNDMLWNAKMRFGKTLTALQVVKLKEFKHTIIFTHRPVVSDGWFEDFQKIFYDRDDYIFGSKQKDKGVELKDLQASGKKYVYFASIQDLRGSSAVGGNFDKNDEVFHNDWDMIIIDEAHEGTQTVLGENVLRATRQSHTKVLRLSGTPFNIRDEFKDEEIYTWDYVMEQKAKQDWSINHYGDSNPYEDLPELNIYTYDLNKLITGYVDIEDKAFNFREFFRVWTGDITTDRKAIPCGAKVGDFVHKEDVLSFLNLLTKSDINSNYPYSTLENRNFFKHSLWMVPGVKEAKALSVLMKTHPVFGSGAFQIVNVAGEGDEEQPSQNALENVRNAINASEYTVTLSCGRLTTGVSVPEWTAVFMLAGTYSTSATSYLQTIFRVQTPANIDGRVKTKCYVFDFAPDRTLKMVAEASKISAKAGKTSSSDRVIMGDFLNYCPVIAMDGSKMKPYDVDGMLQQLKKAYTWKVVRNGFDDIHIYSDDLSQLQDIEVKDFEELKRIIGTSKQAKPPKDVDINHQGLTNEEREKIEQARKKPKKELTEEEKQLLEKEKEQRANKYKAISILRGISIRIPLLVYGADVPFDKEITIENFPSLVDDASWAEFMPNGVDKAMFKKFSKYYDRDIFVAAARQIRDTAKSADELPVTERVEKIANLFATFKNPDKETVLTPWRVVNMHMGDCLGGYNFFDPTYTSMVEEPRYVYQGTVTDETLGNPSARILEINSKTGLYPLYVAYSIFKARCKDIPSEKLDAQAEARIWRATVEENVYVICKTQMARSITKRTLVGYSDGAINAHAFDDLLNQISGSQANDFIKKVKRGSTFRSNNTEKDMKFDAVVGNPPYQEIIAQKETANGQKRSKSIFQYFQIISERLGKYTALIYPGARWIHRSGKGLEQFGLNQINDCHLSLLMFYPDSTELFKEVGIADGISLVVKDMSKTSKGFKYIYSKNGEIISINANCPGQELFPLNPRDIQIVQCLDAIIKKYACLHTSILSQKLFSIESDFVEKNPTLVREYTEGDSFDPDTEIKLFTNDKAGKSGRARWYITNKSVITSGVEYLNKWKVIVSSANAGGQKRSNQISIVDNHSAFGRSRVALKAFETEREAQNFFKYATSEIIRFAFLLTDESLTSLAKKVPDLIDYSDNNGLVNYNEDVNLQLYKLFGIDEKNQQYIKEVLAAKA